MFKSRWTAFTVTSAFVFTLALVLSLTESRVAAQSAIDGQWTASFGREDSSRHNGEWNDKNKEDNSNKLHLNFDLRLEKGKGHSVGQNYEFTDFQGLTREQVTAGGPVKFSLMREAGSIECEGRFESGKGSGTFRFIPDASFISNMRSRGFDFEKESSDHDSDNVSERLFSAATLNVTTALADDLASSGFGKLNLENLFQAAIFKIDSKFMREMKATGFPNLGMEELVKARIFKIDPQFVNEVSQLGFNKQPFEGLVQMRIFKITPEFISEVRNEGFTNVSMEELVQMRIFKIDANYIREARANGVRMEVETLVQRKIGAGRHN